MKAEFKVGNLTLVAEGTTPEGIFKELALLQATFEDSVCGKCRDSNLQYVVRNQDGFEFLELRCKKCGAKLSFGKGKEDKELYPRRYEIITEGKDKGKSKKGPDGKSIIKGSWGWVKYNRESGVEE